MIKRLALMLGSRLLLELVLLVLAELVKRSDSPLDDEMLEAIEPVLREALDNG